MTRGNATIPDLTLERYLLGELPASDTASIAARASGDPEVRARLAALMRSNSEIRAEHPDDWWGPAITERARRRQRATVPVARVRPRWIAATGLAAAFVVAIILAPVFPERAVEGTTDSPPALEPDRIKGDVGTLVLYRKAESSGELLTDGDPARRGDLIRVAYRLASPRFGVIVSIDGRGVVTRHLPVTGEAAIALEAGPTRPLDQAYELDDAPLWERFYLITAETTFDVQTVLEAARTAAVKTGAEAPATLPLRPGFEQASFLLRKVS